MSEMNRKKKLIVVYIGSLDIGGAEKHLVRILPELKKRGYNIWVYTTSHRGMMADEMESLGVKVVTPAYIEFLSRLGAIGKLPRYALSLLQLIWFLVRYRPAISHYFLPGAYLLGGVAGWLTRARCMVMSRRSRNEYQAKHPIASPVEWWLHKKMALILANSKRNKQDLINEGANEKRLQLIYNGLEVAQYGYGNIQRVRKSLNVTNNTFAIAIVGNLYEYKGHADLMNALGLIKDQLPKHWCVWVIGDDRGCLKNLQSMSQYLGIKGNVHFLGQRSDVSELLHAADMGVLCSHEEGFSNALLECMASSLAMVVTDVGGNPDAIADTGIIVPSKNPEMLAQAILKIANNKELRQQYALAARKRVEEQFSLQACINQYDQVYSALLSSEAPMSNYVEGHK